MLNFKLKIFFGDIMNIKEQCQLATKELLKSDKLKKGDIIVKLGDTEVTGLADFRYELYKHNVGDKIKITYYRNGKQNTTDITLGKSE